MKHPFDVHVGARLRLCRRSAGMTCQELGARLGVGAREIREFERGEDRINAGLLRNMSAVTGVPPAFFFDGLADALGNAA
jgi:transcriptional regulator with XRE-family HTH domain